MSSSDDKKIQEGEIIRPEGDAHVDKVLRGEVHPEFAPNAKPTERLTFWETVSIRRDDLRIVIVIAGQQKRQYFVDDPDYERVKERLLEQYRGLAPGKRCSRHIYADGSEEFVTSNTET